MQQKSRLLVNLFAFTRLLLSRQNQVGDDAGSFRSGERGGCSTDF